MYSEKELEKEAVRMVNNPTYHEQLFINKLNHACLNYQFQVIIGFYIVDFLIPNKMLIIELDGLHHKNKSEIKRDKFRDSFLKNYGFRIIRINNTDVINFDLSIIYNFTEVTLEDLSNAKARARAKFISKYDKYASKCLPSSLPTKLTPEQKRKRRNNIANKRKKVKRKVRRSMVK